MTRGDLLIVIAVAGFALLAVPVAGVALVQPAEGAVFSSPAGETRVALDAPGRYQVAGARGTVTFEVAEGQVRAIAAECPDGLCVNSGVARPGRPIVCAPNGVSAALTGGGAGELDAVSR